MPTGRSKPCDAQSCARLNVYACPNADYAANDLVTGDDRVAWERELTVDDVQVGAADTTRLHGETYLPGARIWHGALAADEW
jgi:hypothetical protein